MITIVIVNTKICKECGLYHSAIKAKIKREAWCSQTNNQMVAIIGLTQTTIPRVQPFSRLSSLRGQSGLILMMLIWKVWTYHVTWFCSYDVCISYLDNLHFDLFSETYFNGSNLSHYQQFGTFRHPSAEKRKQGGG